MQNIYSNKSVSLVLLNKIKVKIDKDETVHKDKKECLKNNASDIFFARQVKIIIPAPVIRQKWRNVWRNRVKQWATSPCWERERERACDLLGADDWVRSAICFIESFPKRYHLRISSSVIRPIENHSLNTLSALLWPNWWNIRLAAIFIKR